MIDASRGFARGARRLWRLAFLIAVVAIASGFGPAPAQAQTGWLMRYLWGYDFLPNPPISQDSTRFLLRGWFPFDCGQVSNARVIDPEHVELTLDPGPACADTSHSWSHVFVLGMLAPGNHPLEITLTVNRPDSGQVVERGSFEFGVEDSSVHPPPPPPPPPPPGFMPNVMEWFIDPARPNIFEPTHVDFLGWFPYDCGEVANARVIDPWHIELTLRPGPACSDTTRMWRQRFDFGFLPTGLYDVNVHLVLQAPGVPDSIETGQFSFGVFDSTTPAAPPPPPPDDSLRTMLSNSRPNPFASETRFGVSLDQPTSGDVAVFDIGGRRLVTLFRGELPRGTSQFAWNGRRADGSPAPGGIYFYRLTVPGRVVARRVVLLGQP